MMFSGDFPTRMDRVTVLAPYRRDAEYLSRLLQEHQIGVDIPSSARDLPRHLEGEPGALVVAHEALSQEVLQSVSEYLGSQPPWSELPIILLIDRSVSAISLRRDLSKFLPASRLLLYQRPVMPLELVSGIQSALLARMRQRETRDHIAQEVELRHELNHRVKNILTSVVSIFEMTSRGSVSIEELRRNFNGRLNALADVHSAAFQSDGQSVSLRRVTDLIFRPYNASGNKRINTNGPDVLAACSPATILALCLHELATNAVKYGALSRETGAIQFRWRVITGEQAQFWMSWTERGGPPAVEPRRVGYGTRYINLGLTTVLGNQPQMSFTPEGFRLDATGALSRLTQSGAARRE